MDLVTPSCITRTGLSPTLFRLSFTDANPGSKETVIPRHDWDLRTISKLLAAFSLVSLGSASPFVDVRRRSAINCRRKTSKRLGSIINRQCDGDECELTAVTRQDTHSA